MEKKTYRNPNIPTRIRKILEHPNIKGNHKDALESFLEYFERNGGLTPGQYSWLAEGDSCLEKIYDIDDHEKWVKSFTKEMHKKVVTLAKIYRANGSPYWRELIDKALTVEDYIPSRALYNKFVNNKYAKGYLDAWESEPKFPAGSIVTGRSYKQKDIAVGFVIEANSSYPRSHAKGAKVYSVAIVGRPMAIEIEERYLKKYREKKNDR